MLLWIDLETTGLDPRKDFIAEVGWAVTTNKLGIITPVTSQVVELTMLGRARLLDTPAVVAMHYESGLLHDLNQGDLVVRIEDVEDVIITSLPKTDEPIMVAGFSVHFDLAFIREHMPRLARFLSHRVYDVSTLKTFFQELGHFPAVLNTAKHRAAADTEEAMSIAEAYRQMHYAPKMELTHA